MHELSVAIALYTACRKEIASRGGGRLHGVRVEIGELAGVDPALLEHAWPLVVEGTADARAALKVDWHAANQVCPACGPVAERQLGTWMRLCPSCDSPLRVEDASQMNITSIDFAPEAVGAES
jgi:hydrogenase nickel incorporation protein HypA/HybF